MYNVRACKDSDTNFIINSWMKSYRKAPAVQFCPNGLYYSQLESIIKGILAKAVTLVVCDKDDEDHIFGFVCYTNSDYIVPNSIILHYIYMKQSFRQFGIASKILSDITLSDIGNSTVFATHMTSAAQKLSDKFNIQYSPYNLTLMLG